MSEAPIHLDRQEGCARCDGDGHDDITFQPFALPVKLPPGSQAGAGEVIATHWALCPATGEPILMLSIEIEEPRP